MTCRKVIAAVFFVSGLLALAQAETTLLAPSLLLKTTFFSKALGKDMKVNIYLPKGYTTKNKYPVLYLVHGYSANQEQWMPNLGVDKKADRLIDRGEIVPLIIVAPQIDNSYGINSEKTGYPGYASSSFSSGSYEDYLVGDLVPYMDKTYSTIPSREGRFVGGLSMGGWVALHLAFSHTDLFSKVGGHSPAIFLDGYSGGAMSWVYPTKALRTERDPISLAKNKDLSSLKVYLDCGAQDGLRFFEGCEKLFTILKSRSVTSEYHVNRGEHNDAYWEGNAEEYLRFYAGK